ncbi:MAG: glycosyltransferase [Bacteroidetes bacterium]|nr:glycosyltransferase [Bacteroidota bacterium]
MISIIIPAYNEAKLLPRILEHFPTDLLERRDAEIIVSDGGSSDGTVDIARSLDAIVVRHEEDRRQTIAEGRNCGAAAARGDVLVFINADVRISDADRFLAEAARLTADPRIAGVTSVVHVFPEEEIFADRLFHLWHNSYVRFLNLIGEGMGRGECQILTAEMFRRVGGYNASMVAGEDYDLFRRVRAHGSIKMIPGVTVYESPRRFRKYGYLHILWGWSRNALAVIFRNKSSSEEWEAVR